MSVSTRRATRTALALAAVATVFAATACTSSDSAGGDAPQADLSVLGDAHKATGSPVKVGLVTDGDGGTAGSTTDLSADMARATIKYLNDYQNGIDGHVIDLVDCETGNVPSGATQCGSQMVEEQVVATLVPVSAQDVAVFAAIQGSGVPYVTNRSAVPDITTDPNSFVLTNPLDVFDAIVKVAADEDVDSVGLPIIDVPAATGPVADLVKPRMEAAGLDLVYTPIPPSTADMTPQISQMLDQGAGMFVPVGTKSFAASALKALKQNAFDGPILIGQSPITDDFVAAVPGGLDGVINVGTNTEDPNDPDVKLFNAIGAKYDVDASIAPPMGFQTVLSFARMIEGIKGDVTAESVSTALSTMPKPVLRAMGGGIKEQCGANTIPEQPSVCTKQGLYSVLDADGNATTWTVFG